LTGKIQFKVFDSHFHIIDKRFPLVPSEGYMPDSFTCEDYLSRTISLNIVGGAVVSGSFQAFDQDYLVTALKVLGPRFVGVTQLPASVSDNKVHELDRAGVKAVRFNLRRGGSEGVKNLEKLAQRVHEIAGWHVELYVDSRDLPDLHSILTDLPAISIDHLGISKAGFPHLLRLVERGAHVKASGFGRVDFDVKSALREIHSINTNSLLFGTDLPSTRAPRPFEEADLSVVIDALGEEAGKVFCDNAVALYRPRETIHC